MDLSSSPILIISKLDKLYRRFLSLLRCEVLLIIFYIIQRFVFDLRDFIPSKNFNSIGYFVFVIFNCETVSIEYDLINVLLLGFAATYFDTIWFNSISCAREEMFVLLIY